MITMRAINLQMPINSVTRPAPRTRFLGCAVASTLATLVFMACSLMAAAGASGVLAPTLDEWVRQSPLPTARNLTGVAWATATHGFAAGEALTLIETFDGGATWSDVNLGSTSTDP